QGVAQPDGNEKPERSAKDCDQETLEQKFANNLCAGGANCGVNGELSRPRGTSRGKQVRKVRAGDEQHQSDCAKQQSEIGSVFADEIFEQWCDYRVNFSVCVRIGFLQTRGDAFHFSARLIDSYTRFELAPDK